jgi:pimeloyl-ACP methyl ester carboxylesterase
MPEDGVVHATTVTESVRADGPAMIVKGPGHGPLVVVLDPSGEGKHDELPATWRPLTEDVCVVWWRLPSARRTGRMGDQLLADLPGEPALVHLVGVNGAALLALSLAVRHNDVVRSVVLVDPPWPEHDMSAIGRIVNDPQLVVQQVRTDGDGPALPIGHPEVVRAVVRALVSADVEPAGTRVPRPGVEPLAKEAWRALHATVMSLLDTLGRKD